MAQFLKDMLNGVSPSVARGRDTRLLREILDQTAQRLDTELKGQPAVEADLQETLGDAYMGYWRLHQRLGHEPEGAGATRETIWQGASRRSQFSLNKISCALRL